MFNKNIAINGCINSRSDSCAREDQVVIQQNQSSEVFRLMNNSQLKLRNMKIIGPSTSGYYGKAIIANNSYLVLKSTIISNMDSAIMLTNKSSVKLSTGTTIKNNNSALIVDRSLSTHMANSRIIDNKFSLVLSNRSKALMYHHSAIKVTPNRPQRLESSSPIVSLDQSTLILKGNNVPAVYTSQNEKVQLTNGSRIVSEGSSYILHTQLYKDSGSQLIGNLRILGQSSIHNL